jgi:hypothetical protein
LLLALNILQRLQKMGSYMDGAGADMETWA